MAALALRSPWRAASQVTSNTLKARLATPQTTRSALSSGLRCCLIAQCRQSSSSTSSTSKSLRRSWLYVPGSSEKMVRKSHTIEADTIILDLEDSVADHRKGFARESIMHSISGSPEVGPEIAVRINPPSGDQQLASDDLELLLPLKQLDCVVLPKVEHEEDVHFVLQRAKQLRPEGSPPLSLVLSIESPASLLRAPTMIQSIQQSSSKSSSSSGIITSLMFSSEDFCHSAGIVRTRSRRELLFPRQQLSLVAKSYGLEAIDMVCIDYKDEKYLEEECIDGNEIGYTGKQAIHPKQVETIQKVFSPTDKAILRAAKIKHAYEEAVKGHRGAVGVEVDGQTLMIDAPMLKQADATLARAVAAKKTIPSPPDF